MHNAQVPPPAQTKDRTCVKCRTTLPGSNFQIDAAQNPTAWCNVCRAASAAKWGIDESLVEITYGLYVFEQSVKAEVNLMARTLVLQGDETPDTAKFVADVISNLNKIMHHRISTALNRFLTAYRAEFYTAVGLAPLAISGTTQERAAE